VLFFKKLIFFEALPFFSLNHRFPPRTRSSRNLDDVNLQSHCLESVRGHPDSSPKSNITQIQFPQRRGADDGVAPTFPRARDVDARRHMTEFLHLQMRGVIRDVVPQATSSKNVCLVLFSFVQIIWIFFTP
jgi:hypothetical protein